MAQGLGFAVPASTAQWVVGELMAHGRVRRLSLGITVTITPVPRRLVRDLDLLTDQAIEVLEVIPAGPAAAAGIRSGDWIVSAGGRITAGGDDLHRVLAALKSEREVALQIVRDERLIELTVTPRWSG
jgi:S1-C subfamily serine protease